MVYRGSVHLLSFYCVNNSLYFKRKNKSETTVSSRWPSVGAYRRSSPVSLKISTTFTLRASQSMAFAPVDSLPEFPLPALIYCSGFKNQRLKMNQIEIIVSKFKNIYKRILWGIMNSVNYKLRQVICQLNEFRLVTDR